MSKCQGCGITLQTKSKTELGYTTNKENKICERCFRIKNYGEYQPVSLTNQDYQAILENIPSSSLVVYVSDILSLNLSNLPNFPNMLLVLTKRDIFPKSMKEEKVIHKLKKQYPKLLDIICISSIKNYHLDELYQALIKYSKKAPIYLIGYTNSGKSTLINKLKKNYQIKTENSQELGTEKVTESIYPSTTLAEVEIKLDNLTLIDTPGLLEEGNYFNMLSPEEIKKITPKKEMKPKTCQVVGQGSILIDSFARVDYQTTSPNSFVIYTSNSVTSQFISLKNNTFKEMNPHKYFIPEKKDLVLPGLGFIKFTREIEVTLYTPKTINPYVRDNLI